MVEEIEHRLKIAFGSLEFSILDNDLMNYVLTELEKLLGKNGSSLTQHKQPMPTQASLHLVNDRLIHEKLSYDLDKLSSLNDEKNTSISICETIYR